MTNTPPNNPVTTSYQTILQDIDGTPLITIDSNEYSVLQPDGTVSVQAKRTSIVLVDGTTWNPTLAYRANDPVLLAVCATCRCGSAHETPTHGLLACQNAVRCLCGEICCPRHRERCSDDAVRCTACARRYRRWAWARVLFCTEVKGE